MKASELIIKLAEAIQSVGDREVVLEGRASAHRQPIDVIPDVKAEVWQDGKYVQLDCCIEIELN